MTARTYPGLPANTGRSFTYQYDLMGRLSGLTESGTSQATATYGPASELTNLTYFGYSEARTYNNLLQLTRQTVAGVFDTEYVFPTGQNNGQISASIDHISGQQVNYTYDVLKRLTAAATTGGTPWGEAYTYDGFGNLNAATVTQGSGVNWANASDPATNRLIGVSYDANGNNTTPIGPCCVTTYDVENRMVSQTASSGWIYDPSNKRVGQMNTFSWTLYFYDIFGKQIETVAGDVSYPNTSTTGTTNVYFGGKMIQAAGVTVVTDRLGSVRANSSGERFTYLPYGSEQTPTADGRYKFGTYLRDSTSPAQDYADQRYYNPWYGRFNTPDPTFKNVDLEDPGSFNLYTYVNGDPVNFGDPTGQVKSICEFDPSNPVCSGPAAGGGPMPIGGGAILGSEPHPAYPVNDKDPIWGDEWDNLSADCQKGLQTAIPKTGTVGMLKALNRAVAAEDTLMTATQGTSIDWTMLAAIGIRESRFLNLNEQDGTGVGVGVFQLTVSATSPYTTAQATNLASAASAAAQLLDSNMKYLSGQFPNFTPDQLLQATAASYNMNPYKPGNFSGDPNKIDDGTTHGNYGSNILQLMRCFQ